ncbi:MAG: transcription antitermination factor NusB [Candidatus Daviesbacteria bacterium]|nr:transcription antitermination factor NusB [Candidatus Daviesbacteria bacterium]
MKTSHDPRHLKRSAAMQELFTWQFNQSVEITNPISGKVIKKVKSIDKEIKIAAPTWPLDEINPIDLSILRLAIFELIIDTTTPFKVVVDEAIELAKEFGSQTSPSFINGVLGHIISTHKIK